MLFGPQQGLESLSVGLVIYFNLLYHLLAGFALLCLYWKKRLNPLIHGIVIAYFLYIDSIGLYLYIKNTNLDIAAIEKIAELSEPNSYRLRKLSYQLYLDNSLGKPINPLTIEEINQLIPRANSINTRTENYHPAIWYLAGLGAVTSVKKLVDHNAVLDDQELYPSSPLFQAIAKDQTKTVHLLLNSGADPNTTGSGDKPAIFEAVDVENNSIIQALIEAGADIDKPYNGRSAFQYALLKKRADIVELLLNHGAKPITQGKLAIAIAWENNDQNMIEVLLKLTNGFETQDEDREGILFSLINHCELADFKHFLALGANPDIRNFSKQLLLERIISLNTRVCDFDKVRSGFSAALLAAGANPNQTNSKGYSLLIDALYQKRLNIARQLIHAGAGFKGDYMGNVLTLAARAGMNDVIDQALTRGFDINKHWKKNLINTNALLEAVQGGHTETVKHLFQQGAKLDHDSINTAFINNCYRSAAKYPDILEILITHYLAGERRPDKEKFIRHWVKNTKNKAAALSVLDRLGLAK